MNKAITDGLQLMPPPFQDGLAVWSQGNGTPPTSSYEGVPHATLVTADADFAGCLEVQAIADLCRVRYKGETPILPGCYLRIHAQVKVLSGPLPTARIGAWAGGPGGVSVAGVPEIGPAVPITEYGRVFEVSAIVGTGTRTGVDMPWGLTPVYGHFGVEFTGALGAVIRVDDISIEDVTGVFHRKLMDWVDVRDFGAVGDGTTDDSAAFEAADAAALGRRVLVPEGVFYLGEHVNFESEVRFEGTVTMPDSKRLSLSRNFDLNAYYDAFGDEVSAFKRAFQALLNFVDHDTLDLCGRTIELFEPIDMQAAVANKDRFEIRRVIRNGQFTLKDSAGWDTGLVTSDATYDPLSPNLLSDVDNISSIEPGSLVEAPGVGREVYVTSVNAAAQSLTLSQPLYDAAGRQSYTFRRFRYAMDFSGFVALDLLVLDRIDFRCNKLGSGVLLPPDGEIAMFDDCSFTKPKDRAITSHGRGCQGLMVRRCQFISPEVELDASERESICFNVNANDSKIQQNRAVRFKHFVILNGTGHLVEGNHWFQGDTVDEGTRTAGLVLTQTNVKTTVTGNYVDNAMIEWTNEHDQAPEFNSEFSFGGLTVTANIFTANRVGDWFRFIVVKPYGPGHYLHGVSVTGNVFKSLNGNIGRVEMVDTSISPLDVTRMRNVTFDGNAFNGVSQVTMSPVTLKHEQATASAFWIVDPAGFLPFDGLSRTIASVTAHGAVVDTIGATLFEAPAVTPKHGPDKKQIRLDWSRACTGAVQVTVRSDKQT